MQSRNWVKNRPFPCDGKGLGGCVEGVEGANERTEIAVVEWKYDVSSTRIIVW